MGLLVCVEYLFVVLFLLNNYSNRIVSRRSIIVVCYCNIIIYPLDLLLFISSVVSINFFLFFFLQCFSFIFIFYFVVVCRRILFFLLLTTTRRRYCDGGGPM